MILKSTSRKDRNFRQIIEYLHKEGGEREGVITWLQNINVLPDDLKGISQALKYNDRFRKKRRNGVVFFHDIMAFAPQDTASILNAPWILADFMREYIRRRAPHALVVARPHIEEEHIHIHFIISGSEYKNSKSLRLSKKELENIKTEMRAWQQERFPKLIYSYQQNRGESTNNRSQTTWQMEKRGQIQDQKEQLKNILLQSLYDADSWTALMNSLNKYKIKLYRRQSQIAGVEWKGKKFRFATLIRIEKQRQEQLVKLVQNKIVFNQNKIATPEKFSTKWSQIREDLREMERERGKVVNRKQERER